LDKSPPNAAAETGKGASLAGVSSLAVVIVGMHRSGTSALAGVLNKLGVAAPEDLLAADEHNTRGYFEPERIINFHERLLARLGSPSNDPLPLGYDWVGSPLGEAAAEELAEILDEEFADNAMCLFKDPRICRLMPVWSAALAKSGRACAAILPFRDPLEVAGSLAAKAGLGRPYSLFMWLQHVVLGERFTRQTPRSFAAYDALMRDWRSVSAKLQRELGVAWPKDVLRGGPDVDAFLTAELRHQQGRSDALDPAAPLDALCLRVWDGLTRFDADPYDAQAMAAFDAVWTDLAAAFGVFGPLVLDYQRTGSRFHDENLRLREYIDQQSDAIRDQAEFHGRSLARIQELETSVRSRDKELREAGARLRLAGQEAHNLRVAVDRAQQVVRHETEHRRAVEGQMAALQASTFWRASYPLRRALEGAPWIRSLGRRGLKLAWWTVTFKLGRKLRERSRALAVAEFTAAAEATRLSAADADGGPTGTAANAPEAMPQPAERAPLHAQERAVSGHVLFVSGEPMTPGHRYRVLRWAEAAESAGATTRVIGVDEVAANLHEVRFADFVFLWRAAWDEQVESLLNVAREAATPVVFDTDDLMFDPALATVEHIDGIRSQRLTEDEVAAFFDRVRATLARADFCTAPTPYLAHQMRMLDKVAFILPNGFDEEVLQRSRLAVRRRRQEAPDGLVRIGYATGTRTHQRDFAQCADAVAEVLRTHPQARLVAFARDDEPVLDLVEFPAFAGLEAQVEWRQIVPIEELPDELARFDICIAPLEVGNPFCESKSELKFFEAALAEVVTVASPTEPFRRAIRDGETGFLAKDLDAWRTTLTRLVEDGGLRRRTARAALWETLVDYGPEQRVEQFLSVMEQVLLSPRRAARAFELDTLRAGRAGAAAPFVPEHDIVFEADQLRASQATVIIPLYNYAQYVVEALESVVAQTINEIDLIVVNDASTDDSEAVALKWLQANHKRFNRALLIRNRANSGLGFTRNVGYANAETPYVMPLDADNRLRPHCLQQTLTEIRRSGAAFAYPRIRHFGDSDQEIGYQSWAPARLSLGNFIDAMALVRRSAWAAVGGYDHVRFGWEDFDFWCRMVEHGLFGVQVPEYLADYRVHGASMLRTETDAVRNKLHLIDDMERRHPWLRIERPSLPPASEDEAGTADEQSERLQRLLPILRCPQTGGQLVRAGEALRVIGSGKLWPVVEGRPVLRPVEGTITPRPEQHVSHVLPQRAIALIEACEGRVLNLSAGGTARRYDNVVEAEVEIFRHTDVVADAHDLPFVDGAFDLVVAMNAFEHYYDPKRAAAEILRVLKPGGQVLIHTAFLQPLHDEPWHFYNATRHGVERWFEAFETLDLSVTENFNPLAALGWITAEAEGLLRRDVSEADAERFTAATARELVALFRDPRREETEMWRSFLKAPQGSLERLSAGFEYLGRKPG
jgi:glycosyltransferase involved in cell wall biosynthesis/SAM-dependent methyltransferase